MTTHTIRISHSGTHNASASADAAGHYPVLMLRKQLSDNEVSPSNIRWNTTTHTIQITTDGGTTWVDSPTNDPRNNPENLFPLRTGSDIQCNSAANMTDHIKTLIDNFISAVDALSTALAWGGSMALITTVVDGGLGILLDIIATSVAALVSIGTTAVSGAMTSGVYDELTCIFSCYIGSDGAVTQSAYDTIVSHVNSDIGGTAATVINYVLETLGIVLLSNAGATGSVTGDCSACACSWRKEYTPAFPGGFVASTGVVDSNQWIYPGGVAEVNVDWSVAVGVGTVVLGMEFWWNNDANPHLIAALDYPAVKQDCGFGCGTPIGSSDAGETNKTILLVAYMDGGTFNRDAYISRIQVWGTGTALSGGVDV